MTPLISYAQLAGLHREITDAVLSLNDSSIIYEQLFLIKVFYRAEGQYYTNRTVSYAASDNEAGAISKIISGFITQSDVSGDHSAIFTRELVSDEDVGRFGVEVQFSSPSYVPAAVRDKKVLFLALGFGDNPEYVNITSLAAGDVTDRTISDFTCVNPASSCVSSSNAINQGRPLGTVATGYGSSTANILRKVHNSFRKCYVRCALLADILFWLAPIVMLC